MINPSGTREEEMKVEHQIKEGSRKWGSKGEDKRKERWWRRQDTKLGSGEKGREAGDAGGEKGEHQAGWTQLIRQAGRREREMRRRTRLGARVHQPDSEVRGGASAHNCFRRTSCDNTPTARVWSTHGDCSRPRGSCESEHQRHTQSSQLLSPAASKARPQTARSLLPRHDQLALAVASWESVKRKRNPICYLSAVLIFFFLLKNKRGEKSNFILGF